MKTSVYWTLSFNPLQYDLDEFVDILHNSLIKSIAKTIKKDDEIYILFSGGCDSRAILSACLELFPKDQITLITWSGIQNSMEVQISQEISSDLNINHLIYDITSKDYPDDRFHELCDVVSCTHSVPSNILDELRVNSENILVGFMGDAITGGHLTNFSSKLIDKIDLKIAKKLTKEFHTKSRMNCNQISTVTGIERQTCENIINSCFGDYGVANVLDYSQIWDINNRQLRHILPILYYKFPNAKFPFLDSGIINLYSKTPRILRYNQNLYEEMLKKKFGYLFGYGVTKYDGAKISDNLLLKKLYKFEYYCVGGLDYLLWHIGLDYPGVSSSRNMDYLDWKREFRNNKEIQTEIKESINNLEINYNFNNVSNCLINHINRRSNNEKILHLFWSLGTFLKIYDQILNKD